MKAYQRRTVAADAVIAATYLAGHQHAASSAGVDGVVWRRGEQGHGEPNLAQGED